MVTYEPLWNYLTIVNLSSETLSLLLFYKIKYLNIMIQNFVSHSYEAKVSREVAERTNSSLYFCVYTLLKDYCANCKSNTHQS